MKKIQQDYVYGVVCIALSGIFYGLSGYYKTVCFNLGVSVGQVLTFSASFVFLVSLCSCVMKGIPPIPLEREKFLRAYGQSICCQIGFVCFLLPLKAGMSVGDTLTLASTDAVFGFLFGLVLLNNCKLNWNSSLAVLLCISGIVLVSKPPFIFHGGSLPVLWVFVVLFAGAVFSLSPFCVYKTTLPTEQILLAHAIVRFIVAGCLFKIEGWQFVYGSSQISNCVIVAILMFLVNFLFRTEWARQVKPPTVVIIFSLDAVTGYFMDVFAGGAPTNMLSYCGCFCIFAAGTIVASEKQKNSEETILDPVKVFQQTSIHRSLESSLLKQFEPCGKSLNSNKSSSNTTITVSFRSESV